MMKKDNRGITLPPWLGKKDSDKKKLGINLKMSEGNRWYDLLTFDENQKSTVRLDRSILATVSDEVEKVFEVEATNFRKIMLNENQGDQKWIQDVIHSGTLSDKVAALALQIQESPVHQLSALESLVTMANKKEQRTSQLALEALKDLLIHNLLPNRKLKPFLSRSLGSVNMDMKNALLFWYEDKLIHCIEKIIVAIEFGLKSTVEFYKKFCMEIIADLLTNKEEQEIRLLALLVNKLGDPKVVSKCTELLGKLIQKKPKMKKVIIKEILQFIYRPEQSSKAIYNSINFLSNITISKYDDSDIATQLIEGYLSLFEKSIHQKDSVSKLLSSLLTGIHRVYPYLTDNTPITRRMDSIFHIVHDSPFSTATRALLLLAHIALPTSTTTNTKNNKIDQKKKDNKNVTDNSKDSITKNSSQELELTNRFYRALYTKLLSDEVLTRTQNSLFLNLLYRCIKYDPSVLRAMAFLKRLTIIATHSTPPVTAALLFLISEATKAKKSLLESLSQTEQDQQHVEEGVEVEDEVEKKLKLETLPDSKNQSKGNSDKFSQENKKSIENIKLSDNYNDWNKIGTFDCSKREPLFALTTTPSLWELPLLQSHFHPSVSAFAKSYLTPPTHTIIFAGDPTVEFNLSSFLNRFAYKNPKQKQPSTATTATIGNGGEHRPHSVVEEPLNTIAFQLSNSNSIAPEKAFFHKYFGDRTRLQSEGKLKDRAHRRKKKSNDDDDNDENAQEDDDEEMKIDQFADKLAEDLLRGGDVDGPDIDDDDDDDDDGLDWDNDDDDNNNEIPEEGGDMGGDSDDDDDDDNEDEADEDGFLDFNQEENEIDEDDDDDDEDEMVAFDSDGELENEEKAGRGKMKATKSNTKNKLVDDNKGNSNVKKRKVEKLSNDLSRSESKNKSQSKPKKTKKDSMSVFADVNEYEDEINAIIAEHLKNPNGPLNIDNNNNNNNNDNNNNSATKKKSFKKFKTSS